MRFFALGLLMCVALIGCASTDDGVVATSAEPSPTDLVPQPGEPPVPTEVSDDNVGTLFTATEGLVRSQATPFEAWSSLDDNRIAVHFVTGSPECYGANATVTETPTTVTVSLRTGVLPSAQDKACIMIAVYGTLELPLTAPVGSRQVLNGM